MLVYEVQRFFLLQDCEIISHLQKDGISLRQKTLRTFYTKISQKENIKFQNINNNFFKISIKNDDFLNRNKQKISEKIFLKEQKNALTDTLNEKIYSFQFCSLKTEILYYKKQELCILKIFFPSFASSESFFIPKEFKVIKELKQTRDFSHKTISLYGNVFKNFDSDKCFKIIEKNQNFTLNFPHNIKAFDGFRILLFYFFRQLKTYWKLALEHKKKEDLDKFYSLSEKIYFILKNSYQIFEKTLSFSLSCRFKELRQKTKQILKQNQNEELLLLFLSSENLKDLLSDFDIFIKEKYFYQGVYKDYFLKQIMALVLRKKLILFKKTLIKENLDFKDDFLELKILLECFYDIYGIPNLEKLYHKYFAYSYEKFSNKAQSKKIKLYQLLSRCAKNLKIYKGD